jgi:hypothetical protein
MAEERKRRKMREDLDRRRLYNYESWHRKGSRADLPMLYPEVLGSGIEVGWMVRKLIRCIAMQCYRSGMMVCSLVSE